VANSGRAGENDQINTDIENARGADGDDTFTGPANVGNRFVGGLGDDTVDYSARTAPLTITQGDGLANDGESGEGDDIDITIDTIIGGSGNDHITFTTPGARRAEGRNGSDTLVSTSGNDTLIGGNGADSLQGGDGSDYLDGGDGDDSLDGGLGPDVIIGGPGNDTVYYLMRSLPVSVTDDGIANDGEPGEGDNVTGVENVVTTSPRPEGFASLTGGSLRIYGTDQADTIDVRLKTGNPNIVVVTLNGTPTEFNKNNVEIIRVWGWEGDDYIELNHGGNDVGISIKSVIYGHEGNDTIQGGKSRDRIYGGPGDDSIQGGNNVDIIYGDEGNDTIWGGHAKDYLVGGDGNDLIYGNDHQDQIYGGNGNDTIYGGYGADRIWGEAGNDLIYGQWHGDTIYGGPGQDTIHGGSGHDRIFDRDGSIDTIFGDEDDDEAEVDITDIVSGVEVVNRA
jgi:Ca2+-binding RTX toxin-like protein